MNADLSTRALNALSNEDQTVLRRCHDNPARLYQEYQRQIREEGYSKRDAMNAVFREFGTASCNRGAVRRFIHQHAKVEVNVS